ncbi:MAG: hypothetical protein WDW36_005145 [Sanguina aurantia]
MEPRWVSCQTQVLHGSVNFSRFGHTASVVGRLLYVFGGHVLTFDSEQNKKRRQFFDDLWTAGVGHSSPLRCRTLPAPPRRDMASLTHSGSGGLLLLGGRAENGRTLGDAWVFDTQKCAWTLLRVAGPVPHPRKMHAAVSASSRVILFGGEREGGLCDDLWSLKGLDGSEAARWTALKMRPAPGARFGHAMAVSGSSMALFGGCLDTSSFLSLTRSYAQCRELWVLHLPSFRGDLRAVRGWGVEEGGPRRHSGSAELRFDGRAGGQGRVCAEADPAAGGHRRSVDTRPRWCIERCLPGARRGGVELTSHWRKADLDPGGFPAPCERMCHSLTCLADGRLLLLGGRTKEGLCADVWTLAVVSVSSVW